MLRIASVLLVAAVVVAGSTAAFAQRRFQGERNVLARNRWKTDLDKATTIARKTGQPMMVVIRCVP